MKLSFIRRDNRILRIYNPKDHSENNDWLTVYWHKSIGFKINFDVGFYFDNRYLLNIQILWIQIFWHLPIRTKREPDCEWPSYGFYFSRAAFVIKKGKGIKSLYWPWSMNWYRTSALLVDGSYEHEYRGDRKNFWDKDVWGKKIAYQQHPYKYILKSGEVQNVTATIHVKQREWRRRWLMFTPLFNHVDTDIEVDFSDEVGEEAGSWKGGCTGCGYKMLPGETPAETLKRMESERKF